MRTELYSTACISSFFFFIVLFGIENMHPVAVTAEGIGIMSKRYLYGIQHVPYISVYKLDFGNILQS